MGIGFSVYIILIARNVNNFEEVVLIDMKEETMF